jgi:hypothetical protein
MRIFTTYLIETECSCWELDWSEYRKDSRYWAYTKPQSLVFMVLGALAAGFPIVLAVAYSLRWEPLQWMIALGIITLLYELFIWLMGFHNLWSNETNARTTWQDVKRRTHTTKRSRS